MTQIAKVACKTSIDAGLLSEAKALNISPSHILEQALRQAISQAKAQAWLAQNSEAVVVYNQQIAEHGTLAERIGQI